LSHVVFREVEKEYADGTVAVRSLDLAVHEGELLVLVGPSGCGKSTILRLLAGLETVTRGEILLGGAPIMEKRPQERNVAMVFQNYALYPHMTVYRNLEFPLRMARIPRAERDRRVREAAELLDLTERLTKRPAQLSGGQRQRVAMGRAIVREPAVFLMDEPLSNLDAALRVQIRAEIAALQRRIGTTMIYVTHDQVEAMSLGDRIAVMNEGRLQQVGTPDELYRRPANVFVAGFIGSPGMNILPARRFAAGAPEGATWVGIRPEDFSDDGPLRLDTVIETAEFLGHEWLVQARSPEGDRIVARLPADASAARDAPLRLGMHPDRLRFFDGNGNAIR
jgi:ABC-type sugar transport system ATPase subunit